MRTEPSTELSANQFSFRIAPSTYDFHISTVLPRISALGTAADDKWCRVEHEPVLFRPVKSQARKQVIPDKLIPDQSSSCASKVGGHVEHVRG